MNVSMNISTNNFKQTCSANKLIENKIKSSKKFLNEHDDNNESNGINNLDNLDNLNDLSDEIELEKLEKEFAFKCSNGTTQPKNYGNMWNDEERKIILSYMKKNNYSSSFNDSNGLTGSNLYDDKIIQKIAKKTERSEHGVKEEIKKMIFNDYMGEFDTYSKLSIKYNIPEHCIKVLIRIYLEKYGKKILYPLEIENKILKYQVENIKLRTELAKLKETHK